MYYSVTIKDGVITFFNPQTTQDGAASRGVNGAFINQAYTVDNTQLYTQLYNYRMQVIHRISVGYPDNIPKEFKNRNYVLVVDPDTYIKVVGPFPSAAHAEGWSWHPGHEPQVKFVVGILTTPFQVPIINDSAT